MKRILVAEDEPMICEIMRLVLGSLGLEVVCAQTQHEAERALSEEVQGAFVDLSLFAREHEQFIQRVRGMPGHPPVIVCSAAGGARDLARRLDCLLLEKPFQIQELAACARTLQGSLPHGGMSAEMVMPT